MTDAWLGFGSAVVGALVVLVPALRAIRKEPTRRTTDAITLLDSSGQVIGNLTDEIARLRMALAEARTEADAAVRDAEAAQEEAYKARLEAIRCGRRIQRLEQFLQEQGIDPTTIPHP